MLDEVEVNDERLADTSDYSVARNHKSWDHLSALEVPHLDVGHYQLKILIPKAQWFLQKSIKTCLSIDVMMEYVHKDTSYGSEEDAFINDSTGPVSILSMYPPSREDLEMGEKFTMMLRLSRQVDFREAAARLTDLSKLCRLQNQYSKTSFINPSKYFYDKNTARLIFDFEKEGDQVNTVYKDNNEKQQAACWILRCKDSADGDDDIYFKLASEPQTYCFHDLGSGNSVFEHDANRCNPYAKAKQLRNGSCACPPPYTGKLCHQCESGFTPETQPSGMG